MAHDVESASATNSKMTMGSLLGTKRFSLLTKIAEMAKTGGHDKNIDFFTKFYKIY